MNLSSLDGTNGFTLRGINQDDQSGRSVATAGDVNNDGFDDILIGAYAAASYTGESYVVFGHSGDFDPTLDLTNLNGTNGFTLRGSNEWDGSGFRTSSAGDVNGDGVDDILIGAAGADPDDVIGAGETYLVFGQSEGFAPTLNLGSLDGTDGFILRGIEERNGSGASVSSAGDVNGDGFDDILIGALGANNSAGETYMLYGGDDIFDRFDFADGTSDGVIHLANLGLDPADYNPLG